VRAVKDPKLLDKVLNFASFRGEFSSVEQIARFYAVEPRTITNVVNKLTKCKRPLLGRSYITVNPPTRLVDKVTEFPYLTEVLRGRWKRSANAPYRSERESRAAEPDFRALAAALGKRKLAKAVPIPVIYSIPETAATTGGAFADVSKLDHLHHNLMVTEILASVVEWFHEGGSDAWPAALVGDYSQWIGNHYLRKLGIRIRNYEPDAVTICPDSGGVVAAYDYAGSGSYDTKRLRTIWRACNTTPSELGDCTFCEIW
jgi:hypothetical protein